MVVEILSAIDAGRQTLAAGVIADLPDDEAIRLVEAGLARKVGAGETASGAHADDATPAKARRKG